MELVLGEAAPAWSPTATRGRYGDRPVIALLGPQVEGAAARGRERSVAWIGREIEGVWPLLEVVEVDGRGAWLYPHHAGVSLGPLVDGELVPMRVACEIVAELSQRVAALGPDGEGHPGPLPEDVLLDAEGRIHISGFVGPTLPDPSRHDPCPAGAGESVVYRLGVLLAELLCGSAPQSSSSRAAHESAVRRVIIRVMARPGPGLPERLRDVVQAMLAWDPTARPSLTRVGPTLALLAADLPGSSLSEWAILEVPARARTALPLQSPRTTRPLRHVPREEVTRETVLAGMATLSGDPAERDDITAISLGSEPRVSPPRELGTIPVSVGPPPEVARKRPTLPAELFSDEGAAPRPAPRAPPRLRWVWGSAFLLLAAALALASYVW